MTRIDYASLQERLPNQPLASAFPTGFSVLANDAGFIDTIEPARLLTPSAERDMTAIGVIVGNSSITSLLPELPVDAVVMLDGYPPVHDWQRYSDATLIAAPTPDEYRERIARDSNLPELGFADKYSLNSLFAAEGGVIHEYHFLSSEERYTLCREARLATPILHAMVDVADEGAMATIGMALTEAKAQVTFLNPTNVAEYVSKLAAYQNSLGGLPVHPEAFVAWSASVRLDKDGPAVTAPLARWTVGLDNYLKDSEALLAPVQRLRLGFMSTVLGACDLRFPSPHPSIPASINRFLETP